LSERFESNQSASILPHEDPAELEQDCMATALSRPHQTLEEFLAWEREQPERYERVSGVIRIMTGGTIDHNRITLNVADALRQCLRGGDCEAFVNNMKVVTPAGDVMYPDVVVACGDLPGTGDGVGCAGCDCRGAIGEHG
jgi:hypothetical protein